MAGKSCQENKKREDIYEGRRECAGKAGEVLWMRVPCNQGLANRVGPESCVDVREGVGEALTGEGAGRVLSLENTILRGADAVRVGGRQQRMSRHRKGHPHSAWSKAPCTHRNISRARRSLLSEGGSLCIGSREISGSTRAMEGDPSMFRVRAANPKGAKRR